VDSADLELLAVETYERHGFDPREPVGASALARAILGDDDPIVFVKALPSGSAVLFRAHDRLRVAIRRGQSPTTTSALPLARQSSRRRTSPPMRP
jgi:hypothetical protein